jgi:hypothetical protein
MRKIKSVWLLWCVDRTDNEKWVEEVLIDKVLAERALRFYLIDQSDRFHHYLQEKEVFDEYHST